jgi:hypothetical protein
MGLLRIRPTSKSEFQRTFLQLCGQVNHHELGLREVGAKGVARRYTRLVGIHGDHRRRGRAAAVVCARTKGLERLFRDFASTRSIVSICLKKIEEARCRARSSTATSAARIAGADPSFGERQANHVSERRVG